MILDDINKTIFRTGVGMSRHQFNGNCAEKESLETPCPDHNLPRSECDRCALCWACVKNWAYVE